MQIRYYLIGKLYTQTVSFCSTLLENGETDLGHDSRFYSTYLEAVLTTRDQTTNIKHL